MTVIDQTSHFSDIGKSPLLLITTTSLYLNLLIGIVLGLK